MVDDLPATASFSTLPAFNVSVTALTMEQQLLIVGNNSVAAIQVIFPASRLGTYAAPAPQDRMVIKMPGTATTANYEVISNQQTQDGIGWIITLTNDNRLP